MSALDFKALALVSALIVPFILSGTASAFGPEDALPDVETATALSKEELILAFKGRKHLGSYNFLTKDISSFAFEETTNEDGSIRHVQEDKVDTGQWNIIKNTICFDYDDPNLLKACFKIYSRGNCYYHYQVSTEGFARYGFTARSVIDGETPNCEPSYV